MTKYVPRSKYIMYFVRKNDTCVAVTYRLRTNVYSYACHVLATQVPYYTGWLQSSNILLNV